MSRTGRLALALVVLCGLAFVMSSYLWVALADLRRVRLTLPAATTLPPPPAVTRSAQVTRQPPPPTTRARVLPGTVEVLDASCLTGAAGWAIRVRIANSGRRPLAGPLAARVGSGPVVALIPWLELPAGRTLTDDLAVTGPGGTLTLAWAIPGGRPINSAPVALAPCASPPEGTG